MSREPRVRISQEMNVTIKQIKPEVETFGLIFINSKKQKTWKLTSQVCCIFFHELLNTSSCIDKLLLTCEEWVTLSTNSYSSFLRVNSRLSLECCTACTVKSSIFVIRMNIFFFIFFIYLIVSKRTWRFSLRTKLCQQSCQGTRVITHPYY